MPTPTLAEVVGPILAAVAPEQQPLLVAIAERIAAGRYREWAKERDDDGWVVELTSCAEREEEVARRIESLYPDAPKVQLAIRERFPDLAASYASIFGGLDLIEQLATQAAAERTGAATWRAFGAATEDAELRDAFEGCALLEEQSAAVLEAWVSKLR